MQHAAYLVVLFDNLDKACLVDLHVTLQRQQLPAQLGGLPLQLLATLLSQLRCCCCQGLQVGLKGAAFTDNELPHLRSTTSPTKHLV